MLEKRQKYFLNDFFAVMDRNAGAQQVAQQPVPHLVEQGHHLLFQWSRLGNLGCGNLGGREIRNCLVVEHP